jgi:hypothetical protein
MHTSSNLRRLGWVLTHSFAAVLLGLLLLGSTAGEAQAAAEISYFGTMSDGQSIRVDVDSATGEVKYFWMNGKNYRIVKTSVPGQFRFGRDALNLDGGGSGTFTLSEDWKTMSGHIIWPGVTPIGFGARRQFT